MRRVCVVFLLGIVLGPAACADSPPVAPTPPLSSQPQTPGAAPTASLTVTLDSLGSQEAVAAVSDVILDASASTGAALRYTIDFGDGFRSTDRQARHIYNAPGIYNATATVTDESGRSASASREITVGSPVGLWVNSGYFPRINRVEVRALTITVQDGNSIRGVLIKDSASRSAVTGSLTTDRRVRLVVEGAGETFEGALPPTFSVDAATWPLSMRGGSLDGETIAFKRALGEPMGTSPDADLHMRFFSFGAPYAVKQISPVLFDASSSRGNALTYYIEFGDGQVATTSMATHPIATPGEYVARLTVVDRFGRSDSESTTYHAHSLITGISWSWFGLNPDCRCRVALFVSEQDGNSIKGTVAIDSASPLGGDWGYVPYTGTVRSTGEVDLVFAESGIRMTGTMSLPGPFTTSGLNSMTLTFHGGPHDGFTIPMRVYDPY